MSIFTACDFEELNTNPFEMTDEMGIRDGVAVGGAVTAMQRAVVTVGTQADDTDAINQYQVAYNLSADSWSGFFGQNNNWYSGSNNTTYYLQDNWVAATYTNSYTTLLSSWKKIKQESEKTETPEIFALAQILKISAWHKAQGDEVEWWNPLKRYDRVYSSKIFDFTPVDAYLPEDAIRGGTGYKDIQIGKELPGEIDDMFPDYPKIIVKEKYAPLLYNGNPFYKNQAENSVFLEDKEPARVYDHKGRFIGIYHYDKEEPEVVAELTRRREQAAKE